MSGKTMLEIHQKEILDFAKEHGFLNFGVTKDEKIIRCVEIRCEDCIFYDKSICQESRKQWLNSYKQDPAEKFEVDKPLFVSNDGSRWSNRYFAKYKNGELYCWNYGKTSFSVSSKNEITRWKYYKFPLEVEENE